MHIKHVLVSTILGSFITLCSLALQASPCFPNDTYPPALSGAATGLYSCLYGSVAGSGSLVEGPSTTTNSVVQHTFTADPTTAGFGTSGYTTNGGSATSVATAQTFLGTNKASSDSNTTLTVFPSGGGSVVVNATSTATSIWKDTWTISGPPGVFGVDVTLHVDLNGTLDNRGDPEDQFVEFDLNGGSGGLFDLIVRPTYYQICTNLAGCGANIARSPGSFSFIGDETIALETTVPNPVYGFLQTRSAGNGLSDFFDTGIISLSLPDGFGITTASGQLSCANGVCAYPSAPTTSAPEPASLALVALGLAGLGFSRRKQ